MSENLGGNFLTISDEDGNEFELEHLDTIEYNGQVYMAFLPTGSEQQNPDGADSEEDLSMILLKVVEENGEEQLVTLDSEEEMDAVYEQFMESLFEDEDSSDPE